jgi:hypothetical protein
MTPPSRPFTAREREVAAIPQMDDTRFAYLYAIRRRDTREVKIGITADPAGRLGTLQTAHGEPLELAFALPCDSRTEAEVHRRFAASRKIGEWFAESPELIAWMEEQAAAARALPSAEARTQPCSGITTRRRTGPCAARAGNRIEVYIAGGEAPAVLWLCSPHRTALVAQLDASGVEWRDLSHSIPGAYSTATHYHRRRVQEAEASP